MLCKNIQDSCWLPRLKMKFSKYNIFSKIRDSENSFIINLLTGNADILNPADAEKLHVIRNGGTVADPDFTGQLTEKGYLIEDAEEERLYRNKYLDFIDSRDKDEIQIFFVTNYSCNFACTYCYQDQYSNPALELTNEVIDAFFNYIKEEFAGRNKYITIFGGEPLLSGPKQKELIKHILNRANESNLEVSFVTNGYSLEDYASMFSSAKIREVQVTLDGTESVHNSRRFLKGGGGTFDKIVQRN